MIVVHVEMWPQGKESKKYDLARMYLANVGGNATHGDYDAAVMRRGVVEAPWPHGDGRNQVKKPIRTGEVKGHPRLREHVLLLVGKAIAACFSKEK